MESESFSIQDAKLKLEEENAKAAAERQKKRVRERVAELRQELEQAMSRNALLPKRRQLVFVAHTDEDVGADKPPTFVDPGYIQSLTQEMDDRVVNVQEELNWEIEYHTKRLLKLEDRFLKGLDFEVATVCAFAKNVWVQTFRTPALSPELQNNLAKLHALITHVDESDTESATGDALKKKQQEAAKGQKDSADAQHAQQQQLSSAAQRELRRQLRQKRAAELQQVEKSKPSETDEDPRDLEAIAMAEAMAGDYTLKTSPEYQVPENARMNAEKKRRQMCLLEESMHAIRTEFNERVLALRAFRVQVKEEVVSDLRALFEIDSVLGTSTEWVLELFQFHLSKLDLVEGKTPEEFIEHLISAVQMQLLESTRRSASTSHRTTTRSSALGTTSSTSPRKRRRRRRPRRHPRPSSRPAACRRSHRLWTSLHPRSGVRRCCSSSPKHCRSRITTRGLERRSRLLTWCDAR